MRSRRFQDLRWPARAFIALVVISGLVAAGLALYVEPPPAGWQAILFVALAACAGFWKVPLPVSGTLSLGFAFILVTRVGFGLGASVVAGVLSALASGLIPDRGQRPRPHKTAFNASLSGLTSALAGAAYFGFGGRIGVLELPDAVGPIVAYTAVFALVNLGLISMVVRLSGGASVGSSMFANLAWSVPSYLAGGSLATLMGLLMVHQDATLLLLGAPFLYLLHLSYRTRTEKLEEEKNHSERIGEMYRSITEGLAIAIEAKDENTQDHLVRVREYCLGLGEILHLRNDEMEALRAASMLHDVGKVAVPDYILTKPGRLTPEEMQKMQVHPVVGSEILRALPFPFDLAPIVRHHHERWDGKGYPDGLSGETIPLGARILTVVDCYDALTSDRPYREALSRQETLTYLDEQAGKMFDPAIVRVLHEHLDDLEERVQRIAKSMVPGVAEAVASSHRHDATMRQRDAVRPVLDSLSRRIEAARAAGSTEETLSYVSDALRERIPHRTLVVWVVDSAGNRLIARWVHGQASSLIQGLTVRLGERQAGWVALNQKAYSGVRHVAPLRRDGSRSDLEEIADRPDAAALASSVLAPLTDDEGHFGVVALYNESEFRYQDEHLIVLSEVADSVLGVLREAVLPRAGRPTHSS